MADIYHDRLQYRINFFKCQPALNYGFRDRRERWQQSITSPDALATREAMKDVIRFWLDLGCDGFRVDMAASLVKNDPDSLGTIALWQKVRAFLDAEFPEAAMVSGSAPERSALTWMEGKSTMGNWMTGRFT